MTDDKIKYIDGRLKGIEYASNRLVEIWERLVEIGEELNGSPKSPKIKSEYEAMYQRGTFVYHNNLAELMEEEQILREQYSFYEKELADIQSFLKKLNDNEIELLYLRYERGLTFETIAYIKGYENQSIQKKIKKILAKY